MQGHVAVEGGHWNFALNGKVAARLHVDKRLFTANTRTPGTWYAVTEAGDWARGRNGWKAVERRGCGVTEGGFMAAHA
jgi:hypothetical protein